MGWLRKMLRRIKEWLNPTPAPVVPPAELLPRPHDLAPNPQPGRVILHTFTDEHGAVLSFRVRNVADIWGEHGTGSGTLTKDGKTVAVYVNRDIRHSKYNKAGVTRTAHQHEPLMSWEPKPGKVVIMAQDGYMAEVEIAVDGALNVDPTPPFEFGRIVKSTAKIEEYY